MTRLIFVVLWPSFMAAILASGVFFSLFDPRELPLAGSYVEVTPTAAYTLGFLGFWLFCSLASVLTCYLQRVPDDANRLP